MSEYGHRARAEFNFARDEVEIQVANHGGDGVMIYEFPRYDLRYNQRRSEGERIEPKPLSLPVDAARAVYDALAQYFGNNVDNPTALRQDYLAERARVDKLIGAIVERSA
jgi:hypothetical protein